MTQSSQHGGVKHPNVGAVLEPAQPKHSLAVHGRGPLPRTPVMSTAMRGGPETYLGQVLDGNIESPQPPW